MCGFLSCFVCQVDSPVYHPNVCGIVDSQHEYTSYDESKKVVTTLDQQSFIL